MPAFNNHYMVIKQAKLAITLENCGILLKQSFQCRFINMEPCAIQLGDWGLGPYFLSLSGN